MIKIDGSYGEGGGQILRSALGLSMHTGKAVQIDNIRAKRRKPGLLRQHFTAVKAAAEISNAKVEGLELGSTLLTFAPGKVTHGDYHFKIGSAGSTMLVLQTILPALLHADDMSTVIIEGGTHNDMSPPYDFIAETFIPQLRKMGVEIDIEILRYGFVPAGGGSVKITVQPVKQWKRLDLLERSSEPVFSVKSITSQVPERIGHHEAHMISEAFDIHTDNLHVDMVESNGPGNALMLHADFGTVKETITAFGARNKQKERVVAEVIREAKELISSGAPVGCHLADQLLIPMVLAGGGSFRTMRPTMHTKTNIEVIKRFVDVDISSEQEAETIWKIEIKS